MRKRPAEIRIRDFARRWCERHRRMQYDEQHLQACYGDLYEQQGHLLEFRSKARREQLVTGWIKMEMHEFARLESARSLSQPDLGR